MYGFESFELHFFFQNTFMAIMILKSKNNLYFSEQPVLTAEICQKKALGAIEALDGTVVKITSKSWQWADVHNNSAGE